MAITGSLPLSFFQGAIEGTEGTLAAATRKVPMLSGTLTENIERQLPQEVRNSLIANYRTFPTKRWVELSGMEAAPTFEDLPWFLNFFASNQTAGTATAVTAYRYDFKPRGGGTVDDLKSASWEVGNTTQNYAVNGCIGTSFELGFSVGAPATLSMDFAGRVATPQAATSALADRVTEDINGALAVAYIDTTTIGSTAVTNVLDYKIRLETAQTQFWALSGNLHPIDRYRNAARKATVEMTLAFTDTTEYALFQTVSNTGTPRKVRMRVNGSAIAGATGGQTKQLTIDTYMVYQEAPFGEQDGLNVVKFKGESMYDTSAATDWSIQVINALSSVAS